MSKIRAQIKWNEARYMIEGVSIEEAREFISVVTLPVPGGRVDVHYSFADQPMPGWDFDQNRREAIQKAIAA